MTHSMNRRVILRNTATAGLGLAWGARGILAAPRPATGLPYTTAEIAGRLGISMAVFQKERLSARHVAAIRELGIQRIELVMKPETFDFQDRRQTAEVLAECRKQGVSVVSVHGNLQRRYNHPVEEKRRAAAAALLKEIRFEDGRGENPDEWTKLAAEFPTNFAAKYGR